MSWNSKVVWSEGMFLQPQHLQQHDRFLQTQLELRCGRLRPYGWGLTSLKIDEAQLALGKMSLLACSGVLPDGTPFSLPQEDDLPLPLAVPEDARDVLVVLALPDRRPGIVEAMEETGEERFARYRMEEHEVRNTSGDDDELATMHIGKMRLRLALEDDVSNAYSYVGLARVLERRPDNQLVLDPDYIPPSLDCRASARLLAFTEEVKGLLHQRGEMLAARLAQPGVAGVGEIADFLLLQLINRQQPLFNHLGAMTGLHPEALYCELLQLAGELATFSKTSKRAGEYPAYRHDRLAETLQPLVLDIRQSLSLVMDPHAFPIPIEARQFGIHVAIVQDKTLFKHASFVLAVNANLPPETIRSGFPAQVKIGPVEKIRDLVNLQLPGIILRPMAVAPRQLPFHAGFTYFELERAGEYWAAMHSSAGFALHVPGDFPGLQMEFWAIRS
ncbi:type VI secretion system protein ImpJ [Chitinivorax tropicus]|uniref:Type VI secretion system protein ImpJ n=1 Tax=Chitinivorax tropicus TaxID=714531 RepID=A0A840MJE2_9PROT|nr:type VI secretion system baseplate subunit TssK [Chitinivorax tropicus]MBB5018758.1 type VI secretion system protein ImpJ [Chitinivorax tropicus]